MPNDRPFSVGAAIALLFVATSIAPPAMAEPPEGHVRDINLQPVEPGEAVGASDFLNGYTNAEVAAAQKAIPKRETPPVGTPAARHGKVGGRAFLDADADGELDAGERGLGGVLVSDGLTTSRTGPDGGFSFSFKIPDEAHYRFVFATRPTGYKPTNSWFLRLPFAESRTEYRADFGFAQDPRSAGREFRFVVASDSQFTAIPRMIAIAKDYFQITSAPARPAFLVTVGDLTMSGSQYEWDMYDRIRGASNVPVYDGFGGHDGNVDPRTTVHFERRIGPTHYSWDYGGVHFIQFVTEPHYLRPKAAARHHAWAAADLRAIPEGTPVIVVTHYPLPASWFDARKKEGINVLCQLGAHWHLVQRGSRGGVPVLNTAPARGNDWGAYSRAYRWVHVTADGISNTDIRIAGQYQRLEVVAPGPTAAIGRQPFLVLAYDTARKVDNVTCRAAGPDGRSLTPKLTRQGDWGWLGTFDPDVPGEWRFSLEAVDRAGETWKRAWTVEVAEIRSAAPKPRDDFPWILAGTPPRRVADGPTPPLYPRWVAHTGSVHVLHASPVVADGRVYVAVTNGNVGGPASGVLCMDVETGKEVWRAESPLGDVRGPVTVHQGRVFAVTAESWVAAYEAATGKPIWNRALRPEYELGRPLATNQTPPVATRGGLLVSDWPGSQFLLDYATGRQLAKLPGNAGKYAEFATVFDDVAYYAQRGGCIAREVPSGKVLWKAKEGARATSAGIVVAGKFIYTGGGVKALDARTGDPLWTGKWSHTGYLNPVPVVWDDLVLANGSPPHGLDLGSGRVRFTVPHSDDPRRFQRSQRQALGGSSTPIVAGDFAYYGHDDTSIRAIDKSGRVVWEYRVGTPVKTAPVVTGNALLLHDYAGHLWCFTPADPTRSGSAANISRSR